MDEYLRLENISKNFSDRKGNITNAVSNINLNVAKGEFVTLLGPSGCGKTTLLRIIAGFEEQNEGQVFLNGENIDSVAPFNRNMPMVFQNYALFPHMNIYENIAYGLKARKRRREVIRNDVAMACQMMNLVGLENRFPGELSGGQRQRVALARVLVLKPGIILFDEPLSNLDAKLRTETRKEIKRLQQMLGITILYVTHDQNEALSLSDRIVIMNRGRITQTGTPEEIYNNPGNLFVADFVGNANFINAIVEETDGKRIFVRLQNRTMEIINNDPYVFREGEEVNLSIKPEAVAISTNPTDFTGVVDLGSFLGSTTEYRIEFEGSFINAVHSNLKGKTRQYRTGEPVYLKFNRDLFNIYRK